MFGRSKAQVLIAGAGPVGMFLALCLTRRGIGVHIVDEEWRSATRSYALALHPLTLELLDEMGVATEVLSRARRVDAIALYDRTERRARLELERLDTRFPFIAVLPQSELETALQEALRQSNIEVHWNRRLARIEQRAEAAVATIHALEKMSSGYAWAHEETAVLRSQELEVPIVIGADGHASVARQQLGIRFENIGPTASFAVVEFEAEGLRPDEMCVVLDEEASGVLWPMPNRHLRLSLELDPGTLADDSRDKRRLLMEVGERSYPFLELDQLRDLSRRRAPWFKGDMSRAHWRVGVRFERRLASAFGMGRIWLVGDAAHLTGPIGAQSMNVGMKEAADLSRNVAGVLKGRLDVDELSAYGRDRLDEWRFLLGLDAPTLRAGNGASAWALKRAERLVSCLPASGDHFDQLIAQLGLERSPRSPNANRPAQPFAP